MSRSRRSALGRIDPVCWLAVVALLALTALSWNTPLALLGVATAVIAALLIGLESWINRPSQDLPTDARRTRRPRTAPPRSPADRAPTSARGPRTEPRRVEPRRPESRGVDPRGAQGRPSRTPPQRVQYPPAQAQPRRPARG